MAIDKTAVYTCTDCKDKFEYGDFEGCKKNAGGAHVVSPKAYYSKYGGYNMEWKMGTKYKDPQGNEHVTAGKRAQFQGGTFVTTDPEAQAYLDEQTSRGVLITKKLYVKINTTPELRNKRLEIQVEEKDGQVSDLQARVAELESEAAKKGGRRKSA